MKKCGVDALISAPQKGWTGPSCAVRATRPCTTLHALTPHPTGTRGPAPFPPSTPPRSPPPIRRRPASYLCALPLRARRRAAAPSAASLPLPFPQPPPLPFSSSPLPFPHPPPPPPLPFPHPVLPALSAPPLSPHAGPGDAVRARRRRCARHPLLLLRLRPPQVARGDGDVREWRLHVPRHDAHRRPGAGPARFSPCLMHVQPCLRSSLCWTYS